MPAMSKIIRDPIAWLQKGFSPLYHAGEPNRCPSCGRQHWIVGRMVAECAFCGSALPLEQFSTYSTAPRFACSGPHPDELPKHLQSVGTSAL